VLHGVTPWAVALAVLIGAYIRAIDIESWALLIPGGPVGRAEAAFGPRAGRIAAAAVLSERVLLAALVSVVAGQYLVSLAIDVTAGARIGRRLASQDASV